MASYFKLTIYLTLVIDAPDLLSLSAEQRTLVYASQSCMILVLVATSALVYRSI